MKKMTSSLPIKSSIPRLKTVVGLSMTILSICCLYLVRIDIANFLEQASDRLKDPNISLYNATELKAKHPDGIPRILHQTWDDEYVPVEFHAWMQSWRTLHPTWEFWYWTNADVLNLFKLHFPNYLRLYNGYPRSLFRADAMRYFVLYKYGGVYADLDMEAIKPLDPLLDRTPGCLFGREPYEHAYFLYGMDVPVVMNCLMASKPGHPFFKLIQQSLKNAKKKSVLHATGPFLVNKVYQKYEQMQRNQGANSSSDTSILVLNPEYLLPTFNTEKLDRFKRFCKTNRKSHQKKLCNKNEANNWRNRPLNISYTDHHWFHISSKPLAWKHANNFHIDSLLPKRKNMTDVLH